MDSEIGSTLILLLNNGLTIPALGLGTWKSKPGEVRAAVETAIDVGYRHIDCAAIYGNEKEVGEALKAKLSEGIGREELFITSKLWNTKHEPRDVRPALMKTLEDLELDYLDLYLIHWPLALKSGKENLPKDELGNTILTDAHYTETWKEMEKAVDEGLIKSIGLSNFNSKQIDEVWSMARIKPAVLQCESHPYLIQKELINFCKEKKIVFTAYSPLGSPDRPWAKPGEPSLLNEPKIIEIGKKYKKSSAQIIIKWQIQRGLAVIPKSITSARIKENFMIFDFDLAQDDIEVIESFNRNWRACAWTITKFKKVGDEIVSEVGNHPFHPFNNAPF